MSFTATELDTALMAAVFPALAATAPSGKLALTVRVDEAMAVSGTLSSPGLTAGGVTVRNLSASLRCADGQAVLERLEGRIGKAPLSLSGTADLRRKELGFEGRVLGLDPRSIPQIASQRSEEHTSELQSPANLVCRLLLEKKKNHESSY